MIEPSALAPDERLARLRLARTPGVGPKTFLAMLQAFGNATESLERLPEAARRGGRKEPLVAASADAVREEERALAAVGGRFFVLGEKSYPDLLSAVEDPPIALSHIGDLTYMRNARFRVAIVGTRAASLNGLRFARQLAAQLAEKGCVVVSGMARGIDGEAHEGALEEKGGTIAILAGGVNHIYPTEHRDLYRRLCDKGGAAAESAWGTTPTRSSFILRNRIISGLCHATVVVEADKKSGSLATAEFAASQSREVCAVPGSPYEPRSVGTNHLIKQGAHPVTCLQDVLDVLPDISALNEDAAGRFRPLAAAPLDEREIAAAREKVRALLSPAPERIEDVADRAGVSLRVASVIILEMELAGKIERRRGNKVALVF